ncbi:MAG: hypothetical protein GC206_11355 [Alphaproteobacteria bacterium]|nr:hypothetical protein [Alphaproteobacteria bacterium]
MREALWTAPGASMAHDLTHAPPECLADGGDREAIELGRALFRSPTVLGGPAARIGLSCASCHANGRANARFFLPELTDTIGAADVTSEWASDVRGDGVMNPRPIPDLVDVGARTTFGSNGVTSLRAFVHAVIVEEFQGAEPPPRALDGMLAYLRALRADACPAAGDAPASLAALAADVRRAHAAARASAGAGDDASAALALLAAQDAMARIVERLPARAFARARRDIEGLARDLGRMRTRADLAAALAEPGWRVRFDARIATLAPREDETYFNEVRLAAALR